MKLSTLLTDFRAFGALSALAALALLASCGGVKAKQAPPTPVTAAAAVKKDVPLVVTAIGTVQAYNTVALKALVGGQLMTVHVKEGQDVRKGDLLFTIDPRPYQAALAQAEGNLARDRARLVSAHAQAERYSSLVGKDYITKQEFDDATANSESFKATVQSDEAAVEDARLNLAYCSPRAPIDGRLGNLAVREGNIVKANDDKPLVTLNTVTPVYVAFSLPEQRLPDIRGSARGDDPPDVIAAFPDRPESSITGKLTFMDNAVDPASGTILLKATFANADKALWPGQFVNVSLTLRTEKDAIVVPSEAIQQGQQGYFLYVIKPDKTVEKRRVNPGQVLDGQAVIAGDVQPGDLVVTDGQLRLVPGSKVEIKADSTEAGPVAEMPSGQGGNR